MNWRAWYQYNVYDSRRTDWVDLPPVGLQILIHYSDSGRAIYDGADWYWLYDGKFGYVSSGDWGSWKPQPNIPCISCIKKGVGLPNDEFAKLSKEALEFKWR